MAGVWWLMFGLAAAVYVIVAGPGRSSPSSRDRRQPDPEVADGAGVATGEDRGGESAFIWAGGIVAPVVILAVLAVVTVTTTKDLRKPDSDALQIEVTAKRWWWDVRYPDSGVVTADEIHIPVGPADRRGPAVRQRHPQLLGAAAGGQGRRHPGPDQPPALRGVGRRGPTWARAPSTAASSTPGWASWSSPTRPPTSSGGWPAAPAPAPDPRRRRRPRASGSSCASRAPAATPSAAPRPPARSVPTSPTSAAGSGSAPSPCANTPGQPGRLDQQLPDHQAGEPHAADQPGAGRDRRPRRPTWRASGDPRRGGPHPAPRPARTWPPCGRTPRACPASSPPSTTSASGCATSTRPSSSSSSPA